MNKIAIIGAGASGIVTAILAKKNNPHLHIDLFEANDKIGKKILASGNGRCNVTNIDITYKNYMSENIPFVKEVLKDFSYECDKSFFSSLGLMFFVNEQGKAYPLSNEAKSIVKIFEENINLLGINLHLSTSILDIKKNKSKFSLKSEKQNFNKYDKVVVTSGLLAAPQINGNNDGVKLVSKFGHKCIQTYPSLVGLHLENPILKLFGVKKKAHITLLVNGKKIDEITEDLLFTKYGISGFGVLDISQQAVYNLVRGNKIEVVLNLMPTFKQDDFFKQITNMCEQFSSQTFTSLLYGFLPIKMTNEIIKLLRLDEKLLCNNISKQHIQNLSDLLFSWKFKVIGTQGYKHSEVCGGGIDTKDIKSQTLESKICKNLYFGGEVMDVVGNRGGYNLHFAWSCGKILANEISK